MTAGRRRSKARRPPSPASPGATSLAPSRAFDVHTHFGYEKYTRAAGDSRAEHYTPENLYDHFQRAAYRGLVRTVFYDQRSHGRSGMIGPRHERHEESHDLVADELVEDGVVLEQHVVRDHPTINAQIRELNPAISLHRRCKIMRLKRNRCEDGSSLFSFCTSGSNFKIWGAGFGTDLGEINPLLFRLPLHRVKQTRCGGCQRSETSSVATCPDAAPEVGHRLVQRNGVRWLRSGSA